MKIRAKRYYFDKSTLNKVLDVLSMKLVPTRGSRPSIHRQEDWIQFHKGTCIIFEGTPLPSLYMWPRYSCRISEGPVETHTSLVERM